MLFNSLEFLTFLPLVFIIYWFLLGHSRKGQNLFVVVASYFFYGLWDWRFLALIAFSTLLSYVCALTISNAQKRLTAKIYLIVNISVNLLILGIFKYYNFFVENLISLFHGFGITFDYVSINVILPVGISFYTFQTLSYSIDVYRKQIDATSDIVAFFAYVSFFPQLVAGPIERASNLLPQFLQKRTFKYEEAIDGMRLILLGFFKKIVIADNCAAISNTIFDNYQTCNSYGLIMGALAFTFQIYGDFSGYSDIAIGVSRLFGIRLNKNFQSPYYSRSIPEFWRRWHISLNTWFRDYVYIPMGGNRCGKFKQSVNSMTVFLLSGLWHGANWTYITWGAYHGILTLPNVFWKKSKRLPSSQPDIFRVLSCIMTFCFVVFGWIIFRSSTIGNALGYIVGIFTHTVFPQTGLESLSKTNIIVTIVFIIVLLFAEWANKDNRHAFDFSNIRSRIIRWAIYILITFSILLFAGKATPFVYFQF